MAEVECLITTLPDRQMKMQQYDATQVLCYQIEPLKCKTFSEFKNLEFDSWLKKKLSQTELRNNKQIFMVKIYTNSRMVIG